MASLRIALIAIAVGSGCTLLVSLEGLTAGVTDATDAAKMVSHPTISCAGMQCDPSTSFCCVDRTRHCGPLKVCRPLSELAGCAGNCGYALSCDDTADCADAGPDLICCAELYSPNLPRALSCLSLRDCQDLALQHRVACDPTATTPCPGTATCAFEDGGILVPTCNGL